MFIDFAIDRGGTFTDIYAQVHTPDGTTVEYVLKLLSCSKDYQDATAAGIKRVIESVTGDTISDNKPIPTKCINSIKLGSTIATNALIEKRGTEFLLLVTKGFKDLLLIGNQQRPKLFDLSIKKVLPLYKSVFEVNERVVLDEKGNASIETPLDLSNLRNLLRQIRNCGVINLAVSFCHSVLLPDHERMVQKEAYQLGFENVVCSHTLGPIPRYLNRTSATCIEAYLSPVVKGYIDSFKARFEGNLANIPTFMMLSDGSIFPLQENNPPLACRMILSGPAGGVKAVSDTQTPTISFDMGGTSTDVARILPGSPTEIQEESIVDGHFVAIPQLKIETVAAGGGSILKVSEGMLQVGPESAGAVPGPIVYGLGGQQLTVTDANFILGRVNPKFFASNMQLNLEDAKQQMQALALEFGTKPEKLASDFIDVANEAMCKPIRNMTEGRGYSTKSHQLNCFGGASGQHCCAMANILGIDSIFIHRNSSILSAVGISKSPIQLSHSMIVAKDKIDKCKVEALTEKTVQDAKASGLEKHNVYYRIYLRYEGSDLIIPIHSEIAEYQRVKDAFIGEYKGRFGFEMKDRKVIVQSIEVIVESSFNIKDNYEETADGMKHLGTTNVYLRDKWIEAPVLATTGLEKQSGPALIVNENTTIWLEPGWSASTTLEGHLLHTRTEAQVEKPLLNDVAWMTRFSLRFMSIAEQMGTSLRQSAISTNIKERLDFSCAVFDAEGSLIANAPHIPVHLGAMQSAIQYQLRNCANICKGDVLLSNHPKAGGSHLPDITIMRPVFIDETLRFWTAARGHHADIGGIVPGSIPANSKFLWEEGACIKSLEIVTASNGFNLEGVKKAFVADPARYEGCSGVSRFDDTIADLTAQVGATARGEQLLHELVKEATLDVLSHYIGKIRENAKEAVGNFLERLFADRTSLAAEDLMDDGTVIQVRIYKLEEKYVIDFEGTGPCVYGNWNAPQAITISAVMYTLRCLINKDIPLNAGVLDYVDIKIPPHSLLDPPVDVAVVGGNVLTSQRIVDVLLRAFSTPEYGFAASHGCCNNLCFGRVGEFGFYETIGGGSGATHDCHGASGVHTHMTNTRITDVEIMEQRYPIIVRRFALCEGSGGKGKHNGGDGIVRVLEFKKEMLVSISSERRTQAPYGLFGGSPGKKGVNLWRHQDIVINLGGKAQFTATPGDQLEIHTAGGGGFQDTIENI